MMLSDACLSDVCLCVAYIGPKSRTERPRKTTIGTEVAHVTRDSDTTFRVKRSKVKVTGAGTYCAGGLPPTACFYLWYIGVTESNARKRCPTPAPPGECLSEQDFTTTTTTTPTTTSLDDYYYYYEESDPPLLSTREIFWLTDKC